MKLPSEILDVVEGYKQKDSLIDSGNLFFALTEVIKKNKKLWSHILELREALEKNAKCPRLMHDPDCWKCKTLTNSIKKWGPSDDR